MVLEFKPKAAEDLVRIRQYYDELAGPQSATKHVKTIRHSVELLRDYPGLGMSLEDITKERSEYRYLVTDKCYLVIYRLEENAVIIVRILDGRSNYLAVLFE